MNITCVLANRISQVPWYDVGMTVRALSVQEIAEHVGLEIEAVRAAVRNGRLGEPDVVIGESTARPVRGWTVETVDQWAATRRGRGRPRRAE